MPLTYQPGIDALRAIAVVAVLLFHLDIPTFSGGFVGVDAFFVISGYLITRSIQASGSKFSFAKFYGRRFLRLYPALITILLLTVSASVVIADPASLKETATSAVWAALSASNIYYWLNQGYFDTASQSQPLLHTWTLGVEWQFYLIWAPIAALLDRRILWFSVITAASLIASQWLLSVDSSAAYYMMPTRMFELALGAILATSCAKPSKYPEALAIMAIAMLGASIFLFTGNTPFPGVAALVPTIGALLWIHSNRESKLLQTICIPPVVYLGKISYSVYLVHWPLIVLFKYYEFGNLTSAQQATLGAASIALGAALYHAVERPFLRARKPLAYWVSAALCSVFVVVSAHVILTQGYQWRIPADYLGRYGDPAQFHADHYGGNGYDLDTVLGEKSKPPVAVIAGDSFALQYASGLDALLKNSHLSLRGIFAHGCYLSPSHTRIHNGVMQPGCHEKYDETINALQGNKLPLILAQHWAGYYTAMSTLDGKKLDFVSVDQFFAQLITNLEEFRAKIGDHPFIIIGSPPNATAMNAAASCLFRPRYINQPCDEKMQYDVSETIAFGINGLLRKFAAEHSNTYYVDPATSICPNGKCSMLVNGGIVFSDGEHLSRDGSLLVAKDILNGVSALIRH